MENHQVVNNMVLKIAEYFKDLISAVFSLAINIVHGVGQLVVMIPQALLMLTNTIGFMPTVCIGIAMALVMINIVYLVVNR